MATLSGMRSTRRLRRPLTVLLALVLGVTAACNRGEDEPAIEVPPEAQTSATTTPPSTILTVTKDSLVLSPDGLGPLRFGEASGNVVGRLTTALGAPDKDAPVPPEKRCGATRVVEWSNLQILVNNAPDAPSGSSGFVGWFYGIPSPKPSLFLKTETRVGLGTTVAALKAAYGEGVDIERGEQGPAFSVMAESGILLGQLTSMADTGMVVNIQSGSFCGV
jgi:hypothetical protein